MQSKTWLPNPTVGMFGHIHLPLKLETFSFLFLFYSKVCPTFLKRIELYSERFEEGYQDHQSVINIHLFFN